MLWKWILKHGLHFRHTIVFLFLVGSTGACSQTLGPAPAQSGDTSVSAPVRRNWKAEYPKLAKMGFKEKPASGYHGDSFAHEKVLLRDIFDILGLKFESLSVGPCISSDNLFFSSIVNENTVLYLEFLSIEELGKRENGFVRLSLEQETAKDRSEKAKHLCMKGAIFAHDLMVRKFRMLRPGDWVKGGMRVGEVADLFQLDLSTKRYKLDCPSPGIYRLYIPGILSSEISLQLPKGLAVSFFNDLPPDLVTTITVVNATPLDPFPYRLDLKPDLVLALIDAGFEYKDGPRFERHGLTFGEGKAITKPSPSFINGDRQYKFLKPQQYAYSSVGSSWIVFESQEATPTWSDDTKVDVSVYIPPQMDEVVKGLLKKK